MGKSGEGIKVLVVDDSAVSRKLVQQALAKESYTALLAESADEALQLFVQHAPAIVITDWIMPGNSGLELCQAIRADSRQYTYLIVLTSKTEKDNVVEGLAAGADDYLTKPFDAGELLARIGVGRRTIELHRQIDRKNHLLEEMAHTDSLTGLPNRRAIEEWARRQLRGAARHGFPVWVVQADLDHFKNINDDYGHDAGDAVLQRFGEIIKNNTRASDICGRMGGDEFLMVITHVEHDQIQAAVDRLRAQLAAHKFTFGGEQVCLTASFGVSGFPGKRAPEFSALVREADKAMYGAKRAGGNRVEIAPTNSDAK